MRRIEFIKGIIGVGALPSILKSTKNLDSQDINGLIQDQSIKSSGNLFGHTVDPIEKVRVGIIGLGNRGNTLVQMLQWLSENNHCEIIALSDLKEKKVNNAADIISKWQKTKPTTYFGPTDEWKKLANRDDLDLIVIATPWEYHAEMSIYGMEQGKHVASEVPIAYTLKDCWNIISTAERTKRHCIMLENCCYNEEELFVLNMAQEGVFGDLTHAEGAYLHDLRAHLLSETYYEDQWRIKHHVTTDANLYTTHGLGPISMYMSINRGDNLALLTSMSSRELNLSEAAKKEKSEYIKIACGDMNTTMIKTEKGKTIMLQFDVHTGRPYSRINKLVGTKAVHDGYPSRLYIDKEELTFWGHQWLDDEEYSNYKTKYTHPLIQKIKPISQQFKQGHGGMDFVMMYRLIRALNQGLPLDINVYDSVLWSAVTPLSALSVASNSIPIQVPDFTNGKWEGEQELEIMQNI